MGGVFELGLASRRIRPLRAWLVLSAAVLCISLGTGYRASRAARAPQYLFTKTRVVVEIEPTPADAREAAIETAFAEAGAADTVPQIQPMFVLGLLDGALPIIALGGLAAWAWARASRTDHRPQRPAGAATFEENDRRP